MRTVASKHFTSAEDAIDFVKKNPGTWVVKQNGHVDRSFNYVGELESGEDVMCVLANYSKNNHRDCMSIDLQKRIHGIEIGIGRYFNGHDWVGPIEINVEHKNLCDGDLGPKTDEMGTLMWYEENENMKLYQKTLARFGGYLRRISFKGDFEINCIVNEDGIFPLEATPRFGCPSTQLQAEIHRSPWGEFLKAVADGKKYDLKYKKGFAVIVLLAAPPFPYDVLKKKNYSDGITVFFKEGFDRERDMGHIHWEEVSRNDQGEFYISGIRGYILHVSGMGRTIFEAREKTYAIAKNILIPKVFYRNDIGEKFETYEFKQLKKWEVI
jgi:phosphoribosylamine--glycine ligase